MDQSSSATYSPQPTSIPPKRHDATPSVHTFQVDKDRENQERTVIDVGSVPAPTKTDWMISDPSKNVTVSAETKARWELLRALAGVKQSDEPQIPKPEASVKDPTEIQGPHPHEIVAAQVLQASTVPPLKDPRSGAAATGMHRRNASHGRRPQPPGAAAQPQASGSDGNHRLRPLMLPRMVNRTNSGKRPGSNGNVPIVRPSATADPDHDGVSSLSPPRQQEPSRANQEEKLSQPVIQAPRPLLPSNEMLSVLASGLLATAQVSNTVPRPFPVLSPPDLTAPFGHQGPGTSGNEIHGSQAPYHQPQDRPEIALTKGGPRLNLTEDIKNEYIVQRRNPSDLTSNSPGTAPATPASFADKSSEELLVLLASGDPNIMAFIYTEEGIQWLISSTYSRYPMRASNIHLLLTPKQCFCPDRCFWRSVGWIRICCLKNLGPY
jgi:hypothetical protein